MKRALTAAALALAPALAAGGAAAQSAYGCVDLAGLHSNASVEGSDGVFFRIVPDMQTFHPFSDETVERIATLSEALSNLGTTLVFAPVPTKSLAMPRHLTGEAVDLGYDADLAATLYEDGIARLEAAGVAAADLRRALVAGQSGEFAEALPVHRADPRWTARGGLLAAQAVAARIAATEGFDGLAKGGFATNAGETVVIDSPARAVLQRHCRMTLPETETATFVTSRTTAAATVAPAGGGTIFGSAIREARIAVVGTEFTGEPTTNFAGFLAQATGLDVQQYAVSGGGGYGAISSYLTSDAFASQRPAFLVWEVPMWENLARFGDQPMAELAAAASGACRVPLEVVPTRDPSVVRVDLRALDPGVRYTLYVDAATDAAEARFAFRSRAGTVRTKSVIRRDGQMATGRFYVPLSGLWSEGADAVEIVLDKPVGGVPRAAACFT